MSPRAEVATLAVFFLALTLVLSSGIVAGETQLGCTFSSCSITISRVIVTSDWGATIMNDTVSFNANTQASSLALGVPSGIALNLRSIAAQDSQGSQLQVSKQATNATGSFQPYQINLPSSKPNGYSFTVSSVFSGLLRPNASSTPGFVMTFNPFPVIDRSLNVTQASLSMKTNNWPSPTVSGVLPRTPTGGYYTTKATPLNAFNVTVATMTFSTTGTSQNLFDTSASRTIRISQSGSLDVSDTYNVTNRGKQVPSIAFTIPNGASTVTATDLIGPLDPTKVTVSANRTSVSVTPRFGSIGVNASAFVSLHYVLANTATSSSKMPGRYSLTFNSFDNVKFFQPSFSAKIILPTGFHVSEVTGQVPTISGSEIVLQTSSLSPLSKLSFTISYQLDPFWAGLAPVSWVGLIEGALAASVLVYSIGFRGGVAGLAPVGLIGRFVELYDEKGSLRAELDRMEEDANRGAINRADYKRRRRTLDLRTADVDRLLGSVKSELGGAQSRYLDLVKRVERAEAELQVTRSSLNDLRNQYRSGRISRELYESLTSDLLRRRERAQAAIDSVVIGLREEAR